MKAETKRVLINAGVAIAFVTAGTGIRALFENQHSSDNNMDKSPSAEIIPSPEEARPFLAGHPDGVKIKRTSEPHFFEDIEPPTVPAPQSQ